MSAPPLAEPDVKGVAQRYWSENTNAVKRGGGHPPGSVPFFESVAAHRYAAERCIEELARFDEKKGMRVLEVGCGLGVDLRRFAQAGARVAAVDFSTSAATLARAQLHAFGESGDVCLGDGESLPLRSESFDFVWSHGVIHHSPNPKAAAREIYRVLRPGGRAVVMVYHAESYHRRVLVPWLARPAVLAGLGLRKAFGPRATRVLPRQVRAMVEACARAGYRYDRLLALSTDLAYADASLHNPLSLFHDRREGAALFPPEAKVTADARQLYYLPLPAAWKRRLERRLGFFLYLTVEKPAGSA